MVINKSNITKQMVWIIITMIFCFSLSSCRKNSSEVNSKQVAFDINRSDFDKYEHVWAIYDMEDNEYIINKYKNVSNVRFVEFNYIIHK